MKDYAWEKVGNRLIPKLYRGDGCNQVMLSSLSDEPEVKTENYISDANRFQWRKYETIEQSSFAPEQITFLRHDGIGVKGLRQSLNGKKTF